MRTLLFAISLFVSTLLSAHNNILSEIETVNSAYKVITGRFIRTQINVAKGTSEKTEGDLYVVGEDQMAQYYKSPSNDLLIINGNDYMCCKCICTKETSTFLFRKRNN